MCVLEFSNWICFILIFQLGKPNLLVCFCLRHDLVQFPLSYDLSAKPIFDKKRKDILKKITFFEPFLPYTQIWKIEGVVTLFNFISTYIFICCVSALNFKCVTAISFHYHSHACWPFSIASFMYLCSKTIYNREESIGNDQKVNIMADITVAYLQGVKHVTLSLFISLSAHSTHMITY